MRRARHGRQPARPARGLSSAEIARELELAAGDTLSFVAGRAPLRATDTDAERWRSAVYCLLAAGAMVLVVCRDALAVVCAVSVLLLSGLALWLLLRLSAATWQVVAGGDGFRIRRHGRTVRLVSWSAVVAVDEITPPDRFDRTANLRVRLRRGRLYARASDSAAQRFVRACRLVLYARTQGRVVDADVARLPDAPASVSLSRAELSAAETAVVGISAAPPPTHPVVDRLRPRGGGLDRPGGP